MDTLLSMVLRDRQVDNYNIFVGQEDVNRLLKNIHLFLDDINSCLHCVENYIVSSDKDSRGLTDPLVDPLSPPLDFTIISSD